MSATSPNHPCVGDHCRVIQDDGTHSERLYVVACVIPAIGSVFIRAIGNVTTHEHAMADVVVVQAAAA